MVTLVRMALALIVLLTVPLGAARVMGYLQPLPLTTLFSNPDGSPCPLPCLFGVRPGETSYEQALAVLHSHPFTRDFRPNLEGNILRGTQMRVIVYYLDAPHGGVSRIELLTDAGASLANTASLGQVITVLGPPTLVQVSSTATLSLYSPGRLLFVHAHHSPGQPRMEDPLESLSVDSQPPELQGLFKPWRGFSSRNYAVSASRP